MSQIIIAKSEPDYLLTLFTKNQAQGINRLLKSRFPIIKYISNKYPLI